MTTRSLIGFTVFLLVLVLIDLYAYKGINAAISSWSQGRQADRAALLLGAEHWHNRVAGQGGDPTSRTSVAQATTASCSRWRLVPPFSCQSGIVLFHGLDDLFHLFRWGWWKVTLGRATGDAFSCRLSEATAGLLVSTVPFIGVLYGIKGQRNFKRPHTGELLLPASFHGLRIVRSTTYAGELDWTVRSCRKVRITVGSKSRDLILFTGDW
ncbi:MAG: hypothetical protein IPK99_18195 [Flavobacteriales bacterium]|nr:hypothetical protein [Flavobacteriales bacterium]